MTPEELKQDRKDFYGSYALLRKAKQELGEMGEAKRDDADYDGANENNPLPGAYPEDTNSISF